jgi:glycosyltransferase involved in cell wall biosynthesis
MIDDKPLRISFFLKSLRGGGAERVMLTVASELASRGHRVDLLVGQMRGPLLQSLPDAVEVHELKPCLLPSLIFYLLRLPRPNWTESVAMLRNKVPKIVRTFPALAHWLRDIRPDVLLSTLPKANIVAAWANHLAAAGTTLVLREANQFSLALNPRNRFDRLLPQLAKRWYPAANGIIAVSDGVRQDLMSSLKIPGEDIVSILNPVDTPRIRAMGSQRPPEEPIWPWSTPYVLSVGKLTPQKDFSTLLKAFACIHERHPSRLVILGEGQDERKLKALAAQLGIADQVRFPGHVTNPYAYMQHCSLFVLSSAWEGCPNVLLEALACGCPIVSTDCPSGPREILANGAYGRLVPVGDVDRLASEIDAALNGEIVEYSSTVALRNYSLDHVTGRYLRVLKRAAAENKPVSARAS